MNVLIAVVNDNPLIVTDPREYVFSTAAWIAQEHAKGDTLLTLHNLHPDTVPEPLMVRRWRREFPAFDLLMIEAEHARADVMVDDTLTIADSDDRTAGSARNSIQARQWAAARLNRERYAANKPVEAIPVLDAPGKRRAMSQYSDADLQDIIRAGLKATSIEGEVVPGATPGAPPRQETAGAEEECGSDTPTPKISQQKPVVTTNEIISDEENFYDEPEF